ncbi:type II toxin-antitoxin system ParD family antitoxin [Rhizobium sp. TH2]|uniref:type II toxin-antitoxin system ParD family antitoxin n=1 Tax=Rhizobium sp. TH2 TaxID=2775403 RepID=UPI0021580585|nr:type II toxin-antitoxin system ParD family antitoxin [Rhizobium sp. TH2]UVC06772.1 type II toxin-antitoxin system ParD family antitoxin [Rhizobium sp. TH2]
MGEIKLSEHFEEIIKQQMDSGRYASAADVIEAGLTLLAGFEEIGADEFEALKASINEPFDDGSDDIPIEVAMRGVHEFYTRDTGEKPA